MNSFERLVVVGNPNSSAAHDVQTDVIDRLFSEGYLPQVLYLPSPNVDDVAEEFSGQLRVGDRVLVAGGDGTYHLAINALRLLIDLKNGADIGFMAYGNRCDGAQYSGPYRHDALAMASGRVEPQLFLPLRYLVNPGGGGELLDELAVGYVTIGDALAPGAITFNTGRNREIIRRSRIKLPRSALIAAGYLLPRLGKFDVFPEATTLNGAPLAPDTTDIIALHSLTMAGVLKNSKGYYPDTFETMSLRANDTAGLLRVVIRSMAKGMPTGSSSEVVIQYPYPVNLSIQADGEGGSLVGVELVVIDKPPSEIFKVLMPVKRD